MKTKQFLKFLIFFFGPFFLAVPSCSDGDPSPEHGTIMFTSNADCDIRLFDCDSIQIARQHYEVGKYPVIVSMKSSGEYIVHALNYSSQKTLQSPLIYKGGNLEYYIEF